MSPPLTIATTAAPIKAKEFRRFVYSIFEVCGFGRVNLANEVEGIQGAGPKYSITYVGISGTSGTN